MDAAPPSTADLSVRCTDVRKVYAGRGAAVDALGPISLDIRPGEFVSLVGPSGCGKSTLLRIVAGLIPQTAGEVSVDGRPVAGPQTQVGMVFQKPLLLEWMDVLANITLRSGRHGIGRAQAEERARRLLRLVNLDSTVEKRRPSQLSGGMQQRVAVCRALLRDPKLLLMDEPFGALDALTRDKVGVDLQKLWDGQDISVLMVTHSIEEAVFLSDRVIVLTERPAQIRESIEIDLPRPRTVETKADRLFQKYEQHIREIFASQGS